MKLHLPTRLRAAVLACFAVVTSFSTTLATGAMAGGAFAVTVAAVAVSQAQGAAFDSITYGGDFYISDYQYSFILEDVGSNGGVVSAYWGSTGTGDYGANVLTVTDNGDGTYSVSLADGKLNNTNIDATSTFTSNRGTTFDGLALKTGVLYTVTANGIVGGDGGAKATILGVAAGTSNESGSYNSNMNGNQNPPNNKVNDAYAVSGSNALIWTGDMAAWKNALGVVTAPSSDKVLYFDATESVAKTANVGGDISVDAIKVYDNYTINAAAAANIAAANGVTVVGDKTMTLSADAGNTSTNTVSADFTGALAVSSGNWAMSGAMKARSLAVNGGALTLSGVVNLSDMNFAATDGDTIGVSAGAALTFADSSTINLGNLEANTAYKIFDLAGGAALNGWNALTAENFIVNGAALNSTVYEVTLTDGIFKYSMLVSDLTWNGGASGVWDFSTSCWSAGGIGSSFGNDVNVIFNNTASVELQGVINAGKMTITSGNTLTLSASEGNSISVTDLDIQGSLQNSVAIAVSGNVTMADAASWTLTNGAAQVLTEAQFAAVKNMEVQNGASVTLSSITTGQNGTVDATQLSGAGNVILKLRGDNGVNFNLANFAGDIRVEKADGHDSARLQLNNSVFHADSTIILQTNGDLVFNGTGTEINNDIVAEGTTKFFVNSGKTGVINSTLSGPGTITKEAGGTLTLNGDITVSKFTSNGGTTNVNAKNVTRLEVSNGTTNVLTGSFGDIRTSGGTTNVQGGTVANWLDVRGGTVNLSGGTSAHLGVGQGGTLNVTGAHTTGQLRMSEQGVGNVNIRNGADLVITGSENGVNTSRSILISHWGHASTLLQEGGTMTAEDAVVFTSWTGTGTYKVTGGTATVKGISFFAQSNQIRGSFLLGGADTGYGRVNIGSEGISKVSGDAVDVKLGNGTLGATADWTMGFDSGATSANVQLIGTVGGTVFDTMGHTVTVNTTLGGDGKLVKEGEGTLDLIGTVTSTGSVIAKGGMLNIKSAGPNSFAAMEIGAGGALTIETDAVATVENLKLSAPLTNKGTLTISGTLTVDLTGFTPEAGSGAISYVDSAGNTSDNGYRTGNFTYKLIDNTGTLNDDAITSVVGSDGTYADGILTTTTPDYSNYWVNTTVDAEPLPEGSKYYINGGTLNVGTDGDRILRTTAGTAGTMKLTSNAALRNNQSTLFEGKLTVESGATLTIGQVGANNQSEFNIDVTSLSSLNLNGGTLELAYAAPTIPVLNVTAASTYSVDDIKAGSSATQIEKLNLSESLTVQTNWKSNINVDLLTGSGDLTVRQTNGSETTVSPFSIAAIDNYTGKITVGAASEHSKVALSLNISNGQTFSAEKLEVAGTNASAVLLGSGTYNVGSTLALGDRVSLGSAWAGTVAAAGVTADGTLDASGLCSTASSALVINGLTVNAGAALTLGGSGNTELAGNVVLKESILAGSSNISFATGASLDLTGLTAATDGEWKVLTLFTGADVDLNTLTSAMLTSATQALGSDWTFGSDGTVKYKVVAAPSEPVRYYYETPTDTYWVSSRWSLTDDDTSNLISLPTDRSNVVAVFSNSGTESSSILLKLNAQQQVYSLEVVNGYYEFLTESGSSGTITCTGDLVLGANGHLKQNLFMNAANLSMAANSSLEVGKTLTLAENGNISVEGAGAAIKLGNGQNLTASALNLSQNATLALSGTGASGSSNTVTVGTLNLGGGSGLSLSAGTSDVTLTASALELGTGATISIGAGQVLDLTAVETMDDEDTGKFSSLLNATSGAGTLKVSMPGEFRMKTDTAVNVNLEADQLKINSHGTGGKTLTIGANGSVDLSGRLILQSTAKAVVSGGSVTASKIELGHSEAGNPGHLEMTSGSITTEGFVHYNTNNTFTMSGGTLDITTTTGISNGIGATISGGTLKASGADGWGVTGATIGGATVSADSAGKVTLTNATITGNITGNNKLVLAGTATTTAAATVSGATVGGITLTSDDASALTLSGATLTAAVNNNAGKLVLTGTTNVVTAGFTAGESVSWSASGNGYKTTNQIYQVATTLSNLDATGATWQMDGASTGFTYADGALTVAGTQDTTTYWVNSGTVAYADTDTTFASATTIKLNGNSADGVDTLKLNTSPAAGLSIVATTGSSTVVNLNGSGVELNASQLGEGVSASTVTLTGSGKYTQAASGNALNLKVGGVTDSTNWTGTVSVSGRINGLDADALGNANSWVELKGVSGYPIQSDTINTNILLTNSGSSPALNILNGWGDSTVTFAGQVSGSGDIMRGSYQGGAQTYAFTGDISGWTGSFKSGTSSATTVMFAGGSVVNAGVNQSGNTEHIIHVVLDDAAMTTPGTLQMNGDIAATSLTVTEGTTAKLNGSLALTGALTTNGTTQLPGDAATGTTLGQVAGTGVLEVLTGDLTLTAKSDFGTLKMAADSTLKLDLTTLGVTDLKNWADAPMLTLDTLDTLTTGGALSLDVLAGDTLLKTLSAGDTALLADITDCKADLSSLFINNETVVTLINDGFEYKYELVKTGSGSAQVLITASRTAEGWVATDTDSSTMDDTTWTDADSANSSKWAGADSVGKFFGYGEGTVTIESDGVTTTESVVVSAVTGTTDYTFEGGALDAASLTVNAGTLTINNDGVSTTGDAILSNSGKLTVNADKVLTVGGDMGVLDSATLDNSGSVTVDGTLSVAANATVTNAGTLDVGTLDASGATIDSTGTLISGGGAIGTLTGEGVLENSGELTIESDTTLGSLANSSTLTVKGDLTVNSDITSGSTLVVEGDATLQNADATSLTVSGSATAGQLTVTDTTIGGNLTADSLAVGTSAAVAGDAALGTLTNDGELTVGGKLTVSGDVTTGGTASVGSAELASASFDKLSSTGEVTATELTVTDATLGSLNASGLTVNGGLATVGADTTLASLNNTGSLEVAGDLNVTSSVTAGGTVKADNVTIAGAGSFTALTTGKLTADSLAVGNATITTLDTDKLTVNDGTVSVTNDVSLSQLNGSGALTTSGDLALTDSVSSSVDVTAGEIRLSAGSNKLGSVTTDAISMTEGTTLSETEALMTVDGIESLSGDSIAVNVSQSAFDALSVKEGGQYSAADYLLIDGVSSADMFSYTNEAHLQEILYTGMNAELTVTDGVLSLSISEITDENGEVVGMVWDTADGNVVANNGYRIDTGAGFYKALDYVQQVLVSDTRTFDLSAPEVGDSVAGNASEPVVGLMVRNLRGGGNLTIKGNSAAQDVATLLNTDGKPTSAAEAVALTASAVTVNLGMPKGAAGFLEGDLAGTAPTLASLALRNRAVVKVNHDAEVLGDTDLADYTRLDVQEGNTLTTGMLSGTDEAEISGSIVVRKGGVFTGSYDEAFITAESGSKLYLRTGGRRSLSLVSNGGNVTLDSVGQDGSMDTLRVGENPMGRTAAAGASTLNLLNTKVTDEGITHSTITLTNDEGNYINKAAVTMSLGAAETARALSTPGAPVVFDGVVDVTNSSITVNMMGNSVKNGVLEVNTASDKDLTLARFVTAGNMAGNTVTLTGTPEMMTLINKYYTNVRLDKNGAIKVDRVTDYYNKALAPVSENGSIGLAMVDSALVKLNPQANRTDYADTAAVMDSLDAMVASGNNHAADELGAAVSGASVAALGAAVAGDLERQLKAIRNRTTTMGVDQTTVNENMPYFNAWINAEGDFRRLNQDGTAAGYSLSSWGGTVGFDVDMTPRFTMGLAATAMYGNFSSNAADTAEGDVDSYYLSAFARYASHRWVHTFVMTGGMADTSLNRTVTHANGSYQTEGNAEAINFGMLYEVGYVMALNETGTACIQPVVNIAYTHSSLDGYTEKGSDAGLTMGDVDMNAVIVGAGARVQAVVGENLYNRSSIVEARALIKVRGGDYDAKADNRMTAVPGAYGSVVAAEMGVIGAELGVGITVPVGSEGGAVFADASVELSSGATSINGTVGYRINF